jgi:lysophospholipase L1-like esterase
MSLTAQNLISSGLYDKVIVLSLGIGGSAVAAWSEGSVLNRRLLANLTELEKVYDITDMLWHQGESDAIWGVTENHYENSFESMVSSIRNTGIKAPIFISVASHCKGVSGYPNPITRAQIDSVNKPNNVVLGVNTDELIPSEMRRDNCHFNEQGQRLAAKEAARLIVKFHKNYE